MFNIIHQERIIKADFVVRKNEPFRKTEFERKRDVAIGGVSLAVVTPEDLLLSTLCRTKESSSDLEQRDVDELVRSVKVLDWQYIEKWAGELGVEEWLGKIKSTGKSRRKA